jgi:molecular chaperone GrpE
MAEDKQQAENEQQAAGGEDELNRLRQEAEEAQDRALRIQAELENFRRRTHKEQDEFRKYQALPVVRDLLPGIDNLQRAVTAAEQSGDLQNLLEGIRMVMQQFNDVLKAHSATVICPQDKPFDPNLHEALSQVPSADHEPMTVIQVVENGYQIHDRVVRPAKVIVSCAPPEPAGEAASNS